MCFGAAIFEWFAAEINYAWTTSPFAALFGHATRRCVSRNERFRPPSERETDPTGDPGKRGRRGDEVLRLRTQAVGFLVRIVPLAGATRSADLTRAGRGCRVMTVGPAPHRLAAVGFPFRSTR